MAPTTLPEQAKLDQSKPEPCWQAAGAQLIPSKVFWLNSTWKVTGCFSLACHIITHPQVGPRDGYSFLSYCDGQINSSPGATFFIFPRLNLPKTKTLGRKIVLYYLILSTILLKKESTFIVFWFRSVKSLSMRGGFTIHNYMSLISLQVLIFF